MEERARAEVDSMTAAAYTRAVYERPPCQEATFCDVHACVLQRFFCDGGRECFLDLVRAARAMKPHVLTAWERRGVDGLSYAGVKATYDRKLAYFWSLRRGVSPPAWFRWGSATNPCRTEGVGAVELTCYCDALQRYVTASSQYRRDYADVLAQVQRCWIDVCAHGAALKDVQQGATLHGQKVESTGARGAAQVPVAASASSPPLEYVHGDATLAVQVLHPCFIGPL